MVLGSEDDELAFVVEVTVCRLGQRAQPGGSETRGHDATAADAGHPARFFRHPV